MECNFVEILQKHSSMTALLYSICTGILGIFAGAQIVEGVLFVPMWKSLSAADFFNQHKVYGPKIYRFFAPLTILASLLPIATAVYAHISNAPGKTYALLSAIFCLLFFSTYFLYFKRANRSFAEASISEQALGLELVRWGRWHWARIYLEIAALICALLALGQA